MYKNTHTQNKNSAKKKKNKQTNNTPAKNKTNMFVFCLNLLQDADSIPVFFLFEEKNRGVWLSSMTHTVTQGGTPVDGEQINTSQNWLV